MSIYRSAFEASTHSADGVAVTETGGAEWLPNKPMSEQQRLVRAWLSHDEQLILKYNEDVEFKVLIDKLAQVAVAVLVEGRAEFNGKLYEGNARVDSVVESAVWDGSNVEVISRITGCSASDVKAYFTVGSILRRYEGGGWNCTPAEPVSPS